MKPIRFWAGFVLAWALTLFPLSSVNQGIASTNNLSISWYFKTDVDLVPGTVADGDSTKLQDNKLNSSFVVQVTRSGKPVKGVSVQWQTDDPTGQVEVFAKKTDNKGLARSWYFSGLAEAQTVTAQITGTEIKVQTVLRLSKSISKTVGRYLSFGLTAPKLSGSAKYSQFDIEVTPLSAPKRTYLQLATSWPRGGLAENPSFYGGLQQTDCSVAGGIPENICDKSRGELIGRLMLFSAWEQKVLGQFVAPKVVALGEGARCNDFGHEGKGVQCFAKRDWRVDERLSWRISLLGKFSEFFRVRVSVGTPGGQSLDHFVTMDLPREPDLGHVVQFVEQWGGDEAQNCLEVDWRGLDVHSARFLVGKKSNKPVSATAGGGLYSDSTTRCQNYSIKATSNGIRLASGGLNNWVDWQPIISYLANSLPLKKGFRDNFQEIFQWQLVDISPMK